MLLSNSLIAFGVFLQIFGLLFAGRDIRNTRLTYAPGSSSIETRSWEWASSKATNIWQWIRLHALRREIKPAKIQTATGALSLSTGMIGTPRLGLSPIDPKLALRRQTALLDERILFLLDLVNRSDAAQREDRSRIGAAEDRIESSRSELRMHMDDSVRSLALGGLTKRASGLFVTAVGVGFAFVGQLLQWCMPYS